MACTATLPAPTIASTIAWIRATVPGIALVAMFALLVSARGVHADELRVAAAGSLSFEVVGTDAEQRSFLHHALSPATGVLLGAGYDAATDASSHPTEVLAGIRQRLHGGVEIGAMARYDIRTGEVRDLFTISLKTFFGRTGG